MISVPKQLEDPNRASHPGVEEVEEAREQNEGVVLTADLPQPPPLPHRQTVIRRIITHACSSASQFNILSIT